MVSFIKGIIEYPWIDLPEYIPYLLYANGELTKDWYIINPRINGECKKGTTYKVYAHGNIKVGDYLCTCPFAGVATTCDNKQCAFGIAQSELHTQELQPKLVEVCFC